MRFIFSRPEISDGCGHVKYPKIWWERPVLAWLEYNGVWLKANKFGERHHQLEYNYSYDFFDISVFENHELKNPKDPIEELEKFLNESKLKWKDLGYTWTWDNTTERGGKRFWIFAEKDE